MNFIDINEHICICIEFLEQMLEDIPNTIKELKIVLEHLKDISNVI